MTPGGAPAANATALLADISVAAGAQVIVPPGEYPIDPVSISSRTVNLVFQPGAVMAAAQPGIAIQATNCQTTLDRFNFDGKGLCSVAWKSVFGTFSGSRLDIKDVGSADVVSPLGSVCLAMSSVHSVRIDRFIGRNVRAKPNNIYADQPGLARFLALYNCDSYDIGQLDFAQGSGDDFDCWHIQDMRTTPTCRGSITRARVMIDGNMRRLGKYQGGEHVLQGLYAQKAADFVPYNPSTDVGAHNLNAVDFAGSQIGSLTILNASIDARPFPVCFAKSVIGPANLTVQNCTMMGSDKPVTNLIAGPNGKSIGIYFLSDGGATLTQADNRNYGFAIPIYQK